MGLRGRFCRPRVCPEALPTAAPREWQETMTETTTFTAEESLILERIEREFTERQASDARLQALIRDLHGAFMAAIKIARGDARA